MLEWILVSFGITFSVTHGKLFDNFREQLAKDNKRLGQLVRCPMCLGFWVGMFLSLTWKSVTGVVFLDGFFSLASCWLLFAVSWALALHDDRV
tara:strand:- start:540 stop:818 length:279 start_codon:yes stop_codon:yes gene_type:complete